MRGRPKAELVLSDSEREQLQAWFRRRKTAQALALRSRIILGCASRVNNNVVADTLGVTPQTVTKWRAFFLKQRLDGLVDAPRSGAPLSIHDARVDALIAKTLLKRPKRHARTMARESGLSRRR